MGGSVYYGIIFWHPPPLSLIPKKSSRMSFDENASLEVFMITGIYYDCLVWVMGGSVSCGLIFWPPTPLSYPIKNQIGRHFMKMLFFVGLQDKRKHFTLFRGIIYDILLKSEGGSIYYGIIFWPLPTPALPPFLPLKKSNRTSFDENDNRNHFTLLVAIYYDCMLKIMGRPLYYGIIFWQPPPPIKNQIGRHFIKMLFFFRFTW